MNTQPDTLKVAGTSPLTQRIDYLDGLRGIAILLVVGYHYYVFWAHGRTEFYPYGDLFSGFLPFRYGYFGVQLFFAISGFVIALSLERCHSIAEFAVRRFARLWPTMLLCSLLTSAVLAIWPRFWAPALANLLTSLSFIDGRVWSHFISHWDADWVDGVYWTLFVEVRFYALAAAVYFLMPRRFMAALAALAVLAVGAQVALRAVGIERWAGMLDLALIPGYLPWFLVGVAALADLRGPGRSAAGLLVIAGALLLILVLFNDGMSHRWTHGSGPLHLVAFVGVVALLFAPAHVDTIRRVLCHPWLTAIGVSSYSLYLLHQYAGITLIAVISDVLALHGAPALAVSLLVLALFLGMARSIFMLWETPINRAIVARCLRARPASARDPQSADEPGPLNAIGTAGTIGAP